MTIICEIHVTGRRDAVLVEPDECHCRGGRTGRSRGPAGSRSRCLRARHVSHRSVRESRGSHPPDPSPPPPTRSGHGGAGRRGARPDGVPGLGDEVNHAAQVEPLRCANRGTALRDARGRHSPRPGRSCRSCEHRTCVSAIKSDISAPRALSTAPASGITMHGEPRRRAIATAFSPAAPPPPTSAALRGSTPWSTVIPSIAGTIRSVATAITAAAASCTARPSGRAILASIVDVAASALSRI